MLELKARCCFHGVGQGLFYSGHLFQDKKSVFQFIYDCGTLFKLDMPILQSAINEIRCYGTTVNALFLSHLDKDHISGVPYLLEQYTIENVFLPYFSPQELLLLATQNDISESSDLYNIYLDPIGYFLQREIRVYVVYPQDQIPDPPLDISQINDNNPLTLEGNYRYNPKKSIVECYGSLTVSFRGFWRFRIYQDQEVASHCFFVKKINESLHLSKDKWASDLKRVLASKETIATARRLYYEIENEINQSSLVLLHAPFDKYYRYTRCWEGYPWCSVQCGEHYSTATLLNGDINLNKLKNRGNDYKRFIAEKEECIGVFLLPHHGSGKNISINMIKSVLNNRSIIACSYGRGNHYNHPDAYTLDRLSLQMETYIHHVVSGQGFDYFISN